MMAMTNTKYDNIWSRLFLRTYVRDQFPIVLNRPKLLNAFLKLIENDFFSSKFDSIVIDRPIFLVGLPRSGTTMLQDVLCSHPAVAHITNTMNHFNEAFLAAEVMRKKLHLNFKALRYLDDGIEFRADSANEGQTLWARWLKYKIDTLEYIEIHRQAANLSPLEKSKIYADIKKIIWYSGGSSKRFFCKNPGLIILVDIIQNLFPDARFIHIVRDPRDCAPSMLKLYQKTRQQESMILSHKKQSVNAHNFFLPYPRVPGLTKYLSEYGPEDLRATAYIWKSGVEQVHSYMQQIKSILEVRHEDILENPEKKIREILEYCELFCPSNNDLKFWNKVEEYGKYSRPSTSTRSENLIVDDICRDLMEEMGYI